MQLMATDEEPELEPLKTAVIESLEKNGSLNEIRAHLCSLVFEACDQQFNNKNQSDQSSKKSKLNDHNLLINQLIREYFKFNNYKYSLSVFETETGENTESNIDRISVQNKLGFEVKEENKLPLLNTIVEHFLERKASI